MSSFKKSDLLISLLSGDEEQRYNDYLSHMELAVKDGFDIGLYDEEISDYEYLLKKRATNYRFNKFHKFHNQYGHDVINKKCVCLKILTFCKKSGYEDTFLGSLSWCTSDDHVYNKQLLDSYNENDVDLCKLLIKIEENDTVKGITLSFILYFQKFSLKHMDLVKLLVESINSDNNSFMLLPDMKQKISSYHFSRKSESLQIVDCAMYKNFIINILGKDIFLIMRSYLY